MVTVEKRRPNELRVLGYEFGIPNQYTGKALIM